MGEDKDLEKTEDETSEEQQEEKQENGNIELSELSDGSIVMHKSDMDIPDEVPVIGLDGLVMFPFMIAPVVMSGESEAQLVHEALQGDRLVGVFLKKDEDGPGTFDNLYETGSLAVVLKMLRMPDGGMRLLLHGIERIRITEPVREEPYPKAKITALRGETEITRPVEAMMRQIKQMMQRVVEIGQLPDDLAGAVESIDDPGRLADLAVSHLSIKNKERQKVLEAVDVEPRLELSLEILGRELDLLELGSEIQTKVSSSMNKNQRQYMLREQLKAIQKELGEDSQNPELAELKEEIEKADLPDYARETAEKELKRLEMTHPSSPEYSVSRNYLDWIISLPWNDKTQDSIDLKAAQKVLNEDHYALDDVKDRVLEHLAVIKLKKAVRGPILCFVGPPGVGKTSMGKSIARAMGREFHRFSLGGMRDEAEIRGHRRTYIGSMPGRIIKALKTTGKKNPLIMLDEIDKLGTDFRGDPASALLEVLDPEQNNNFTDHYLDMPFDLSEAMFITTANVLDTIPRPLQDRMEMIKLSGYTTNEKLQIAKRYLMPRAYNATGVSAKEVEFKDEGLLEVIENYTREAGVRNLEREIGSVCRRVAKKIALGDESQVVVDRKTVKDILGPQKVHREMADRTGVPGVATGLAWTQVGGEILFVEASAVRGSGELKLTGQLGDVMKESAMAAMNVLHSNVDSLGISEEAFSKQNFHVHVPAGATPKDGPSAGITLACAICSLVLDLPVKDKLAMTGEITLKGNVLVVGGIKEKVLAAHRAGIKEIILPSDCKQELEKEVPDEVKQSIRFYFVEDIRQVLSIAFPSYAEQLRAIDASAAITPQKVEAEQIAAEVAQHGTPVVLLPDEEGLDPDEPRPPLIIEPGEPRQGNRSRRNSNRRRNDRRDRSHNRQRDNRKQQDQKKQDQNKQKQNKQDQKKHDQHKSDNKPSDKADDQSKDDEKKNDESNNNNNRSSSRRRRGRRGGRNRGRSNDNRNQDQNQKRDDHKSDDSQKRDDNKPSKNQQVSKQEQKQEQKRQVDRGGVRPDELNAPKSGTKDDKSDKKQDDKKSDDKESKATSKKTTRKKTTKKATKKTTKKKTTKKKTASKKTASKKTTKKTTKKKAASKKTTKKKTSKKSSDSGSDE